VFNINCMRIRRNEHTMKKRIKTLVSLIMLSGLLVVSGFGCKGLSQQERASLRPVTLNYWTVYGDVDQLRTYAAEYSTQYPHVTVNIRQVRYEEFDSLFTNALADDVGPDIVSMHVRWLRKNESRLSPAPSSIQVSRLVTKNQYTKEQEVVVDTISLPREREVRNNYVQTVAKDVVFNQNIFGFPMALDTLALFYNQTILDRSGVAEAPKTWDEFVRAVQQTTKFNATLDIIQSGVAMGTSQNIDNFADIVALLMLQSGVTMVEGNTVTFGSGVERDQTRTHPTIRALDFYTGFARATADRYSWNEKMQNAFDEFVRGRTAFFIGFAYDFPRLQARAPQLPLKIAPIPQLNPETPANVANYWVESVVKKSKNQNEAWGFVQFITSKEKVREYVTATSRPSPYREQITAQQESEILGPFATQALYADNWYRGREVDVAIGAMKDLVTEYLRQGNTPEETLRKDRTVIVNTAAKIQQTY